MDDDEVDRISMACYINRDQVGVIERCRSSVGGRGSESRELGIVEMDREEEDRVN